MAKWVKCKSCGHEFSSSLSKCPECSKSRMNFKTAIGWIFGILFCAVIAVGLFLGFSDKGGETPDKKTETVSSESESKKKEDNSSKTETDESKKEEESASEKEFESEKTETKAEPSDKEQDTPSSNEIVSQEEKNYPIGTIIKNDLVYTTVPKYYLEYVYNAFGLKLTGIEFEKFAYDLDDDDKAFGISEIIKNPNGSATAVLSWSKLNDMKVKMLTESLKYIKDTENRKYITKIVHTEKLDKFKIILNTEELTAEQETEIMLFGVYFLEYQYYSKGSDNKCEIVLVYPDSSKQTLNFPEIIKP